jgi:hypothetical protein
MRAGLCRCAVYGVVLATIMAGSGAAAALDRIEISRGADSVVHGSCVPSLRAFNHTQMVVDYLEVTLSFTLKSGEQRTLELRSRYREGAERPIAPGTTADLKVQLDLSRPLGADCADIVSVTVVDAVCESAGKSCTGVIAINPAKP